MGLSLKEKALFLAIARMPLSMILADGGGVTSENVMPFTYGGMDNWIVREIHKSGIIGGNTKWLYELGPSDTVVGNAAFHNMDGSPWATSDMMAKMAGVVKTNTSAFLRKRGDRVCARIGTRYENVKVFGLVDIEVITTGSAFSSTVHEPIKGTKDPQAMLQSGMPSSKKSKALRFDYKVKTAPGKSRIRSTGFSRRSTVAGRDSLMMILLLQKRWEDKEGDVYSKRVGTMVQRYTESTPDWIDDTTYSILYGNITSKPEYKPYVRMQVEEHYTLSSKGKNVPIQEVGWAEPDKAPTHTILQFTSSHGGAYIGSPGNTFWIDNMELIC